VTALTWGHNDRRLFIATNSQVCVLMLTFSITNNNLFHSGSYRMGISSYCIAAAYKSIENSAITRLRGLIE
jgi:hypothetical protein